MTHSTDMATSTEQGKAEKFALALIELAEQHQLRMPEAMAAFGMVSMGFAERSARESGRPEGEMLMLLMECFECGLNGEEVGPATGGNEKGALQ